MNRQKGITLIALVITIIVLLILAGVSILSIISENGILIEAQNAKRNNSISEFIEIANIEYSAQIIQEKKGGDRVSLERIAVALREQGYAIENINTNSSTIYDLVLLDENEKEIQNIKLLPKESKKYKIDLKYGNSSCEYYVKLNQLYYKISLNDDGIELSDGISNIVHTPQSNITLFPTLIYADTKCYKNGELTNITDSFILDNQNEIIVTGQSQGTTELKFDINGNSFTFPVRVEDLVGKFVYYDIDYNDFLNQTYSYNESNGWRILNYTTNEGNSEKYNIEIVSTGIPFLLYYAPHDFASWYASTEKVNELYGLNLTEWSENYSGYYAEAGLLDMSDILINHIYASYNMGTKYRLNTFYSVKGIEESFSDFLTWSHLNNKITGIRMMTYDDYQTINEENRSLKLLAELHSIENAKTLGIESYKYTNPFCYYLGRYGGSPFRAVSSTGRMYQLTATVTSEINGGGGSAFNASGIRPVIKIENISLKDSNSDEIWEICE